MRDIQRNEKKKKGFTLIELIIVLAVMAIIAAVAIPNFVGIKNSAAVKADEQSGETIKRAVQVLITDNTITLPTDSQSFTIAEGGSVTGLSGNAETELENALSGLKKPQAANKTDFKVTLDSSGTIKVETE